LIANFGFDIAEDPESGSFLKVGGCLMEVGLVKAEFITLCMQTLNKFGYDP